MNSSKINKLLFLGINISLCFCSLMIFAQPPETFTIDGNKLMNSKNEIIKGNVNFVNARDQLIKNANKILRNGPYSVTYKKIIPPGITRNDYLSLARYWWPNPSTSDGLPYIQKDGKINPVQNVIQDSQMLNKMANDVFELGLAYYFTNDERYAKQSTSLMKVFFFDEKTKMNPNFEFSQIILGKPESGGSTIGAIAFIPFVEGVQLIKGSKSWTSENQDKLKDWFSKFLNWMLNSEKGKKQSLANNNIGTYYTLQTAVYALFIHDQELAKKIISSQGYSRIDHQINGNGEMREELKRATPWNYVKFNLLAFDQLAQVGKTVNIDLLSYTSAKGGSIEKAFKWVVPYTTKRTTWKYSKEKVSPVSALSFINKLKSVRLRVEAGYTNRLISYKDILF